MIAILLAATLSHAPLDAPVRFQPTAYSMREETYTGGDIPANAHLENRNNGILFLAGAGIAGVTYLVSLATAATLGVIIYALGDPQVLLLAIPIVGPFISLSRVVGVDSEDGRFLSAIYAVDGALQVMGVGMMIFAAATRKTVIVFDESTEVTLLPMPLPGGAGLAARMAW